MGRALIEKRLGSKKTDTNLMMTQSVLGSEAGGETIVSRAPSVVNLESLIEGEGEYTDIFDGKKSRLGVEELKSKLNQETGNMQRGDTLTGESSRDVTVETIENMRPDVKLIFSKIRE